MSLAQKIWEYCKEMRKLQESRIKNCQIYLIRVGLWLSNARQKGSQLLLLSLLVQRELIPFYKISKHNLFYCNHTANTIFEFDWSIHNLQKFLTSYPFGKTWLRRLSLYHAETAGNPSSPIPVTRNSVSNIASKIRRLTKEDFSLITFRFHAKK